MNKMRNFVIILAFSILLMGCAARNYAFIPIVKTEIPQEQVHIPQEIANAGLAEVSTAEATTEEVVKTIVASPGFSVINPEGMTLEMRIQPPQGFSRPDAEEGSFTAFLRTYPMKEDGAEVLLYDGSPKRNQTAHAAVFRLPIENVDLQQCADSIMRMYAEYYWNSGQYDKIAFHFTNGFLADYSKWREGYRIKVSGNDVYWTQSGSFDDSYEAFQKYLRMVFSYAGTLSMVGESEEISLEQAGPGDVFLYGGSPGHVIMIVDVCQDANGRKAYLLAQGYMPAQEFHVLKNPLHGENPWYYEEEIIYPFVTPEYIFQENSLKRLSY